MMIPNALRSVAPQGPRSKLRAAMKGGGIIRAPGVVDPVVARLVEAAGFEAVYMTGGGLSRSLGFPDIGLLTMTEIISHLRFIIRATALPVIADADLLNVDADDPNLAALESQLAYLTR